MKRISALCIVGGFALAACDVSHPVAVVGPGKTVYRGSATASFLEGGWFQATNGSNSCFGRYAPASETRQITFPVTCSNGLNGIGTARYETPRAGGGEIVMEDGTKWRFIFGQGALVL